MSKIARVARFLFDINLEKEAIMKKIIIFMLLGVIFLFGAISTLISNPGAESAMKDAIYIDDGKLDSANEGKVVILAGRLEPDLPIYDPVTKVSIPYITAGRVVEEFKHIIEHDYDYEYDWDSVHNKSGKTINSDKPEATTLVAPTHIGEYNIDPKFLVSLSRYDWKKPSEEDLGDCELFVYYSDHYYKTFFSEIYAKRERVDNYNNNTFKGIRYKKDAGKRRYSYSICNEEEPLDFTIVGVQKEGWLMLDDGIGVKPMNKGIVGQDDFKSSKISENKSTTIFGLVLGLGFIGLGVYFIIKRKKKKAAKA